MHDEDTFEFEGGTRGSSQLPAVLMALFAIAAILIVNLTALVPTASASATPPASKTTGFKLMPALMQGARPERSREASAPDCASTQAASATVLRM